ncbi:alpha/beta fold hydrolase [Pilimelia columellifera]|uniref:Carrier domain-containing protein n=1 Tax=Pilimelia columellifera subsp. columellifera TaxID=706583 RepID=A0ABP6ACK6_9ACTN
MNDQTSAVPAIPPLTAGPWDGSTLDRLADIAAAAPHRPALCAGGERVSYAELLRRAGRIAATVPAAPPGEPVATLVPQTVAGLVGIVGALTTGRPVALLDPMLPAERIALIAARAGARTCLTDPALRPLAEAAGLTAVHIDPAAGGPTAGEAGRTVPSPPAAAPTDPAFIVFTSGSTGRPKGVSVSHAMLANEAYGGRERLGVGPADRVALVLPVAFMAGLTVLAFGLLNGATVCPHDPRDGGVRTLPDWLDAAAPTTVHCTPSLLRSLLAVLDQGRRFPSVRLVTTCGEAVHARDVAALRPHLGDTATFTSWSGSSEIGHLAFLPIPAGAAMPDGIVPVGRPAPGKEVTVVGDDGAVLPAGATGEVVVTSAYLSGGYWGDPELTAARFRRLPDGRTVYRTGDLGRFDADGTLRLLGRLDSAVKIRGYLVEPAEVEAALLACPQVSEAAVVPVRRPDAPVALAGYVSVRPGAATPAPATLRRQLAERLPSWMTPATITVLAALPRNERGKLDRAALPPATPPADGPAPRDSWEALTADLWAQVLELDRAPVDADFLDLGGDSLTAEELLAAAQQRFGVALDAADLAAAPTVAGFAARLAAGARRRATHPTMTTLREGEGPAVWCFAGAGGLGFGFLPLARRLGDQPVVAFHAHGLERRGRPDWTVAAAARRHVRDLLRRQPDGPYVLVGHSLGGLIALAAAQLLRASGSQVALVALLDTYLPDQAGTMAYQGPSAADPAPAAGARRVGRWTGAVRALLGDDRRLWSHRLRLPLAGVAQFDGITQYGVFFQQGHLLTRLHRPRPWDGPALLLLAGDNPANQDRWSTVLTGPTELRRLDCDHPSILREPHVALVAEAIAGRLGAAAGAAR